MKLNSSFSSKSRGRETWRTGTAKTPMRHYSIKAKIINPRSQYRISQSLIHLERNNLARNSSLGLMRG
jgi:hypothetical protein